MAKSPRDSETAASGSAKSGAGAQRRSGTLRSLIAKLLFSITLTIVLLEIGLRIMGLRPITRTVEYHDPTLLHSEPFIADAQRNRWIHWPRETRRIDGVEEHSRGYIDIRTNNVSCREDEDTAIEKTPGTIRILVIGDSHTDGVCFNDESYSNLLEQERNRREGANRYEVINAGFGPSSPYQQWWAFEQVYSRFHPDHLVVAWYAGNDLAELLRTDERVHLKWDGAQFVHEGPTNLTDDTRSRPTAWGKVKAVLRDNLALYHALVQIRGLRKLVRSAEADEYRERLEAAMADHAGVVWQGMNQSYYFAHHPDSFPASMKMMDHILRCYREYADEHGIGLTLLVIPTLRQIHPESDAKSLRDIQQTLGLGDEDLQWDEKVCDALVELGVSQKVVTVDLRKPLRDASKREPQKHLYYRFDHHLNVAGNHVLAKSLDEALEGRLEGRVDNRLEGQSEGKSEQSGRQNTAVPAEATRESVP